MPCFIWDIEWGNEYYQIIRAVERGKYGVWHPRRRRDTRRCAARPPPMQETSQLWFGSCSGSFLTNYFKMSWQNYVDQQLMGSGLIAKAIIAGHDGTLWAKSNNIEPSRDELMRLSSSFSDQSNLAMTGVVIGGEKFFYLSGTDKVIRCKKGKAGMHSMKTLQAVLIAVFEEPIQHPQVAAIVESLGDYLISLSY